MVISKTGIEKPLKLNTENSGENTKLFCTTIGRDLTKHSVIVKLRIRSLTMHTMV